VNRGTVGVNSLPKTQQRRDCDLKPGPSAPVSSTLTTLLPSHVYGVAQRKLERIYTVFHRLGRHHIHDTAVRGRWRGVVVSGVRRMNEVNAHRARLVLGWVTVCGRVYFLGM